MTLKAQWLKTINTIELLNLQFCRDQQGPLISAPTALAGTAHLGTMRFTFKIVYSHDCQEGSLLVESSARVWIGSFAYSFPGPLPKLLELPHNMVDRFLG